MTLFKSSLLLGSVVQAFVGIHHHHGSRLIGMRRHETADTTLRKEEDDDLRRQRRDFAQLLEEVKLLQENSSLQANATIDLVKLAQLEESFDRLNQTHLLPPRGFVGNYRAACELLLGQPRLARVLANISNLEASRVQDIPTLVTALYDDVYIKDDDDRELSIEDLPGSTKKSRVRQDRMDKYIDELQRRSQEGEKNDFEQTTAHELEQTMSKKIRNKAVLETELRETLVLLKDTFALTGSERFSNGGFIIRGKIKLEMRNQAKDEQKETNAWLTAKNRQLMEKDLMVCMVPDVDEELNEDRNNPILILLRRDLIGDMREDDFLYNFWDMVFSFYLAWWTYDLYPLPPGTVAGFEEWEKVLEQILPVFIPLCFVQLVHFSGQRALAAMQGLEIERTAIFPNVSILRYAPKSLRDSFDFAMVGPAVALLTAALLFGSGVWLTATASPEVAALFPELRVGIIQKNAAAASIVDYVLGGNAGFISGQDPYTLVPLHPFAVAGFLGSFLTCFSLAPMGVSSGGRLSAAVFGRTSTSLVSLFFGILLLFASLTDERFFLVLLCLVGYLGIDGDQGVPCQNEIEPLDATRLAAAAAAWFVAALVLSPLP